LLAVKQAIGILRSHNRRTNAIKKQIKKSELPALLNIGFSPNLIT